MMLPMLGSAARARLRRARGARRWLRTTMVAGVAAGVLAGSLAWWFRRPPPISCERAVRAGDYQRGVEVCLAGHARTGSERDLSWAAQAHMYLGAFDQAEALARGLLSGPLAGEGHRILSFSMLRRGDGESARTHATLAVTAYRRTGDERGLTSSLMVLAQAEWKVGDLTASLEAADEALKLARRLGDPRNELAAHLARADAFRRMGDAHGAADALTSALALATKPCDLAWTYLKMGLCHMEAGQAGLAKLELDRAAQANGPCRSREASEALAINQAWLLRWRDPLGALTRIDEVTKSEGEIAETLLLRAYIASDRGAFAEADEYLTQAAGMESSDADWPWVIARAHAQLSELRGGLLGDRRAEYHYRRSTAMIASLRGNARARSAYLVSSHRGPYDGLIALLARSGRWREVLDVILELDASDMLRATAAQVAIHDHALVGAGAPAQGSMAIPSSGAEDVLSAWRSRDLVIVIAPSRRRIGPGRERAYRVRVRRGEVTGEDVADASAAQAWAETLFADPGNGAAARALGRMIVPPGAADETLHVLAVGPLGKVPLAALRDEDGSLSIARRPLVRVLALRATGPEACGASPPAVIADPQGDLPGAAAEGAMVARALGPGAHVAGTGTSAPATRARLLAARDAELLHLAVHVVDRGHRRALRLADGDVEPAEMVRGRLAPRLAVLAGCGSAAARDEEGWGSIAAALLESGTAAVVATDRSVDDAASLAIMRDFYAQPDWRTDPERALARVQQALDELAVAASGSAVPARAWAAFFVLRRPPGATGTACAR